MKKSLRWIIAICVVFSAILWISSKPAYAEDFVSVMEALQDISVGTSKKDYFHTAKGSSFIIPKGEHFYSFYTCQPEEDNGVNYGCLNDDDRCIIRYHDQNYNVTSCIWLIDGWMRNPHDSDPFRFINTRPANSPDIKPDN